MILRYAIRYAADDDTLTLLATHYRCYCQDIVIAIIDDTPVTPLVTMLRYDDDYAFTISTAGFTLYEIRH